MSTKCGRVLVTGANGFIGTALCNLLIEQGIDVTAAIRAGKSAGNQSPGVRLIETGDIHANTNWTSALTGVTHIVHLAARVHVMREKERDPLASFRAVNTAGTANLARQAGEAGVRRFVYVSTIKVNGERNSDRPFSANDHPHPIDPYAQSKLEAEQKLVSIGRSTDMEVVIVRPSLVYGPEVKGNFLTLLHAVRHGWPLPLASCHNLRSFIGLTNFVSLLERCLTHRAAAGQVFLASDGEDLSTPDLIRRTAHALGQNARLFPFPHAVLRITARLTGRTAIYDRLCGSLQVDSGKTREVLGWKPPVSVSNELLRTAQWYLKAFARQ